MNKKTLLSLMMLLFAFFGVARADELTVHDSTATNGYVPMFGSYFDDFTKSEFVFPASELADMSGGTITSMKFYVSGVGNSLNGWNTTQQVFLKEVASDTLSDFSGIEGATIVFEGSLTAPTGPSEMEITFSTPYIYNGGNLLVGVYNTTSGTYQFVYFYGEIVNGASGAGYNSNSLANVPFTQRNFLPKTTFTYLPPGDCMPSLHFTADEVGPYFATLSWIEIGTSESWYIYYREAATASYVAYDTIQVTENPYTLTDLEPNTYYEAFVIPTCGVVYGEPDNSLMSNTITFTTLDDCPTPLNVAVTNITDTGATMSWTGYNEAYYLQWGTPSDNIDTLVNEDFYFGIPYNSWTNDASYPWTVVQGSDDIYIQSGNAGVENSTSSILLSMNLDGPGTVEFDAECKGEGSSTYWDHCDFYIDDVRVFYHGADLTNAGWNHYSFDVPVGNHTFRWSYVKDGTTNPSGDYFAIDNVVISTNEIAWNDAPNVQNPTYTFTGLNPLTEYYTRVMGICGVNWPRPITTSWTEVISFSTLGYYTVTVDASPTNGGTVSGGGTILSGNTCTVTATPNTGYQFYYWSINGAVVSYDPIYSFTVTNNVNLVAHFGQIEYYPWFTIVPEDGGWADFFSSNGQSILYGEEITLVATPNEGYRFLNWDVVNMDGEPLFISDQDSLTFTMNSTFLNGFLDSYYGGEIEFIANFSLIISHEITATANPTGAGTITGDGTYESGSTCTLTAIANDGYIFINWTENGEMVSMDATYSFTVTGDRNLVANFGTPSAGTYVDLGLPSGILWATCNVGANTPESYGDYFAWGETQPKETYNWNNYQYCNGGEGWNTLTKYCFDSSYGYNGFTDNLITLLPEDDAAMANWGTDWRMPTKDEWEELFNNTTVEWTTQNGINGRLFTGENGNSLFLPTAGYFDENSPNHIGIYGNYWSSSLDTDVTYDAWDFSFYSGDYDGGYNMYSITRNSGRSVRAVFNSSYTINATSNPVEGGTIEGTGTYRHGQTCTLTATPNTGYTFVNWTKDGVQVATSASISFVVTGNADYIANFQLNSYEITATANPTEGGTVSGSNTYDYGSTCTLIATESEGYTFINWTENGNVVSTSPTFSFTVEGPRTLVANFQLNSYEITATANPTAGGSVTGGGTYNHFETCTLTATANTGYTFINWTKDGVQVSTSTSISFVVSESADYVANFSLNGYLITATANPTEGGTVSGTNTYEYGSTCTLIATESEGYTFTSWTENGSVVSTSPTFSFTVEGPRTLVANFQLNSYAITASANPTAGGSVTGGGTYNHFETCTLTATPNTGYTFINWTKDGVQVSTNISISFVVTESADYVANFQLNSYLITATANPTEGGTVSGSNTYDYGSTCTLIATESEGYTFTSWTENGSVVSTSPTFSFTVEGPRTLVANFQLNSYEITATANPTAGGLVTGGGTYNHFETCTLTATPNTGYTFINWTKDGVQVSTSASISFVVSESADYVANFSLNGYLITATANPTEGGTVSGTNTYEYGSTCTLIATESEGYTFIDWTENGNVVSTSPTFSFTVEGPRTLVANFQLNNYEITATANPTAGGSVTGGGTYNHFETCTLIATESEGYTFTSWTENGNVVSTSPTFSFTVEGPRTLVANFQLNNYEITATANPTAGGSVTGGGTYNHFETCTLTATPNTGYTFINWTKDGVQVSTSASISFVVSESADYVANFSLNGYLITATANPTEGGTVSGTNTYEYGSTCTLIATESEGYTFIDWTENGNLVSTSPTFSFTVEGPRTLVANFQLNNYEITATANPTAGGSVTGGGTYNHFETCTLTATPNTGYTFIDWTENGNVVSTSPSFSFTVEGPRTLVANFQLNSYAINASANPTTGGSVTGGGTYDHFETCTLIATESVGYTFIDWTENGNVVSTSPTFSFTVEGPRTLVANFQLNSYQITASANPTAGGTVTGGGTYDHFETCTLTATPNTGYTFIDWTENGNVVSTSPSFSFTVEGPRTLVANFQLNSYTITASANPTEGGTLTGGGTYNYFETCTLSATANTGYTFVNWTKDGEVVSYNSSVSFTVTEDATYVANFQLNSYAISASANPTAGGTVTGGGTYDHFETCTLIATESVGYTFTSWTENGNVVSTSPTFSFTVEGPRTLVANFQLNSYAITASANPTAGGSVTGGGTYDHFETCTLIATESVGYTFTSWTENGNVVSTSPTFSFTVEGPRTLVANFQLNSYAITASANPTAGGSVTGSGTYDHFETCTLIATESVGYTFTSWTENGSVVSTSPTFSFTVEGPRTLVANFQLNSYTITASANPTSGGSVTGGGTYNHFETCTLIATPSEHYNFDNWTKNGVVVSTSATYSFTVTEGATYVAHFSRVTYQITAIANPTEGGNVSGTGTYSHGSICTLTAIANTGYAFSSWTKDGVVVSSNPSYSFSVTENATYVANFNLNMYTVSVSADPTAGGSVSGGGTFLYGESSTVSAMPNAGYTFTNWTKNGTVVSTEEIYTFTVTEDASLVAHFSLDHYTITVSVDPEAVGTATGGGSFTYGETCNLTATANTGYAFVNWTKDGTVVSSNANYSFTVTGNGDYVAHFAVARYTLTVLAEPAEGGNVYGGGTYDFGHVVTLRAIAHEGYEFDNWTKDGAVIATTPNHPVVVREDAEYVAHFHVTTFEIKANTYPDNTGVIEGIGFYNYGETCTLTVTPNNGYEFLNWTLNGQVVSEEPSFSFIVTESLDFVAYLQADGVVEQGGVTVALYPNPAKRRLTIEASEPVNVLEIYNINGALVYRQNDCSDKVEINVQTYAPGTYMIRLTTDSTVETRRFVKE